ncbi:MAG: hypothetical protein DMD78_19710 [Candidatus Rokuibacteriota bacterium]|nr:MAG: hypothetical protein DMD78_19710 [Candidatus Rokubacteria bacterium]
MKKRKTPKERLPENPQEIAERSAARGVPEEELQGPPARETVIVHSNVEREVEEERRQYTQSSPRLTAGDPDADWRRADSVGDEAPGGTVMTPDQSVVDEIGDALGVPRAPDEEFRPSSEILDGRDRYRAEEEE